MTPESKANVGIPKDLLSDEREIMELWQHTTTGQWRVLHSHNNCSYLILDESKVAETDEGGWLEQNEGVILYNHGGVDDTNGLTEFQANAEFLIGAQVAIPVMAMRLAIARNALKQMMMRIRGTSVGQDLQMMILMKRIQEQLMMEPVAAVIEETE